MFIRKMIYNGTQGQPADTPQRVDNPDQLGGGIVTLLSHSRTFLPPQRSERGHHGDTQHTEIQVDRALILHHVCLKPVSTQEKYLNRN